MRKSVSLVFVVSMALGACGGSDDDDSSTTAASSSTSEAEPDSAAADDDAEPAVTEEATSEADVPDASTEPVVGAETGAPVQDLAADSAAAQAALLTLSDFPAGWSEVPDEVDDSNQGLLDRVYECLGPDAVELFNNETKTRTGNFIDPVDDSSVYQTVTLAPTVESAERYMTGGSADGVTGCLTTVYREEIPELFASDQETAGIEVGEITVGALNVGEIGEGTFAYRITAPVSAQGFDVDIVSDFVAIRVGRSTTGLNFQSTFSPTPIERITEYALLTTSRLPG